MRTFSLFVVWAALVLPASAQQPPASVWHTDFELAKRHAQQTGQLVLVHFWAPWCAPCKELEHTVFGQPGFEQALSSICVPVKLNVDANPAIVQHYQISQIPADILVKPDGTLVERMASPPTLVEYLTRVKQVAYNYHATNGQPAAGSMPAMTAAYSAMPPGTNPPPPYGAGPAMPGATPGPMPGQPMTPQYGQPLSVPNVDPAAAYAQQYAQPAPQQPVPHYAGGIAAPPDSQPFAAAVNPGTSPAPSTPPPNAPAQNAPFGLDSYCPVTLCEQHQWTPGNPEWGVQYRGRTYLFASPEAKQKFWQNPDRYAPVASGLDPVLAIEQGQEVPGQRAHGVFFEDRIYLFANEQSLEAFKQNPDRYAAEILQARR
jgi:YHS domain-containing protein/thiol-disulfide isomerase/thioredoxin